MMEGPVMTSMTAETAVEASAFPLSWEVFLIDPDVEAAVRCDRVGLLQGAANGQEVPHAHCSRLVWTGILEQDERG